MIADLGNIAAGYDFAVRNRLQGMAQQPQGNRLQAMQSPSQGNALASYGSQSYSPTSDLAAKIIETAEAAGADPLELATIISYETAGTFDPRKKGPRTQWGQHEGFIQFGEPQAAQYGVDWENPVDTQLGADGAVVRYLRDAGFQRGMGILDLYSAVNAGRVGRYDASDANNGGAPGTVRDKVESQMSGHRQNALKLLGLG